MIALAEPASTAVVPPAAMPAALPAVPAALARIDSFPYRHRVGEVMSRPLLTVTPETTLLAASRAMEGAGVSSIVVLDDFGRPVGILTERDVLTAVARNGGDALEAMVSALMSAPVRTVPAEVFVYVALGRMDRLNLRHLVVTDEHGRALGMITRRALLKLRAGRALVLGDQIAAAADESALIAAKAALPDLARQLLAEGVTGVGVAAVISQTVRDLTGRAAELAQQAMREDGWGEAPAPWCVLVLGSGGRGESLLATDQDNAIVHAGKPADDAWYAEAGRRIAELLDRAGVPLCKGGVMAKNPPWRHALDDWKAEVEGWIRRKEGDSLLNVDIFYDFRCVFGDRRLADELRTYAVQRASESPVFLRMLAANLDQMHSPIGFFGRIRTEHGRFDIKLSGLLPIVTSARVMALKHRVRATSTTGRLLALAESETINAADARELCEAYELLLRTLLDQQVADSAAGLILGTRVDPRRLVGALRSRVREALRRVDQVPMVVRDSLTGR